jgi:hypothetical protein
MRKLLYIDFNVVDQGRAEHCDLTVPWWLCVTGRGMSDVRDGVLVLSLSLRLQ